MDAIRAGAPEVAGPDGVGPLGAVVDAVVAARRLAGWSLWVELAGLAQLVAFWEGAPPIVDQALHVYGEESPDPCAAGEPDLADRLHHLVIDWQLPSPVNMHELAEAFVTSEISAACGASRHAVGLRLNAARALFLDDRLPRSRQLLQAGLLDWTKLGTLVSKTRDLDDEACRRVEARVIPDADLAAAAVDPLDVRADPAKPGANLPAITRMTNPVLERRLVASIIAIDAAAAAERAAAARQHRHVRATALDDATARLEVEAGQDAVAAVMNELDAAVASAKAAGDERSADQIRTDHAIHRLTRGPTTRTGPARSGGSPCTRPVVPVRLRRPPSRPSNRRHLRIHPSDDCCLRCPRRGQRRPMTQQPDTPDAVTGEVTPAEADSPYASAGNGALDAASATEADTSVEPAPDVAEEYAESIPIDPTPDQVEHYLELARDPEALLGPGDGDSSQRS